jgi:hypothetical protein
VGLHLPRRRNAGARASRAAGFALLVGPEREQAVKNAIVDVLAPFRFADGSYRLENGYRYLIARA